MTSVRRINFDLYMITMNGLRYMYKSIRLYAHTTLNILNIGNTHMHQTLYIFLLINIIICFTSLGEHLKIRQVSVGTWEQAYM